MVRKSKQGKPILIFDLDRTLFDTDLLKRDFFRVLRKKGVSRERALAVSTERFVKEGFHPEKYAEALFKKVAIRKEVIVLFADLMKAAEQYWYAGCHAFLLELRKKHTLILLSYGNADYQHSKIKGTRFEKIFDRIIITQKKDKEQELKNIRTAFEDMALLFLDDSHVALESAQKLGIRILRIKNAKKDSAYFRALEKRIRLLFAKNADQI